MVGENNVSSAASAVAEVMKAVPIYHDAVQPLAKEVGSALGKVGKTINIALAPLAGLIWCYDQIREFLLPALEQRLGKTKLSDIKTPAANIAGPAIEALRFAAENETLREMYANLLAKSMDANTSSTAHPAFVEIIKQLTPDEARIIEAFPPHGSYPLIWFRTDDCSEMYSHISERSKSDPRFLKISLDNLERLGLLAFTQPTPRHLRQECEALKCEPAAKRREAEIKACKQTKVQTVIGQCSLTTLGEQFRTTCVESPQP